jgi:hypothetical protein
MKNPTYAKFMAEIESIISPLAKDDLKKIIFNLAEGQSAPERNSFLKLLRNGMPAGKQQAGKDENGGISPKELLDAIKEFKQRILDGEFYDEERSYMAMDMEEHSYYGHGYDSYYGEDIDFANEEYVHEAVALLEDAKTFFRQQDTKTAHKAYEMLFDIFENDEFYEGEEYFIYGFSFENAIDSEVIHEHKTIYLRCQYLQQAQAKNFQPFYHAISQQKAIFISDIIEIDRAPLPDQDAFLDGFIEYLSEDARNDKHLIDALFVKNGVDEIKKFAYAHGKKHPPVFLYYYQTAKENEAPESELLQILLDGIEIIPEKFESRAGLSLDLIELAKKTNDLEKLKLGYATACYSDPSLKNLAFYLNFILANEMDDEVKKLKAFLAKKKLGQEQTTGFYGYYYDDGEEKVEGKRNIYTLNTSTIGTKALAIGKFILAGIDELVEVVKPEAFLGFSSKLRHVAIASALVLKSIAQSKSAENVDALVEHYCLDFDSAEYHTAKNLIAGKAGSIHVSLDDKLTHLATLKLLAVNRVSHILENKLRGGYESACLLLVACAEVSQILENRGNDLIQKVDTEYKRFRAFRSDLKDYTRRSKLLHTVE